jgi:hypothetical protein
MCCLLPSLCSFLLAAAPLVGFAAGLADELPRMVGKNAEELANEHAATLRSLTKVTNDSAYRPMPWHVWTFNTPKHETRYVVFSGRHPRYLPGRSMASVLLLSESGAELGSWRFTTGWRIDIRSATNSFDDKLHAQVITIYTLPLENGQWVAKQYFALVDDKLYFIRMEDRLGRLIRNNYSASNQTLGGDLPARNAAGWSSLLESPELPLRLAALTYLSGYHIKPDDPRIDLAHDTEQQDAKLARAFREVDSTSEHIEQYRRSDNAWLKEAADLASVPIYYNPYRNSGGN